MNPRKLDGAFRSFVKAEGVDVLSSDSARGIRTMLRFYSQDRADGCDVAREQDMLLFQWGTCDWGAGEQFEVDVSRQVILPDEQEDDVIWQLHLTYRYPVSPLLRALGSGDRWCASPADLAALELFIGALPVTSALAGRNDAQVEIAFERAG